MLRVVASLLLAVLILGCYTVPVSYVPDTGKVGAQSGKACVFKLLGLIPFGSEIGLLNDATANAGFPTQDVAVYYSQTFMFVGNLNCVTVKGSK